ncbi:MAG: hypothetical protein Q8K99_04545 [Actinomycetota bacterium]|nr:hypothetical protein [Actinomycetota bacterium]
MSRPAKPESMYTPALTIVGAMSAVVTVGTFLVQVVPGTASLAVSLSAATIVLTYLGFVLISGRLFGRRLRQSQRRHVAAWSIVVLVFSLILGIRAVVARGELPHPVETPTMNGTPIPSSFSDAVGYDLHASPVQNSDAIATMYYVVSDPNFFETLFERRAFFDGQVALDDLEATDPETLNMIGQLLDPDRSSVMENDVFRFMRALWVRHLGSRRPIAELSESFGALEARPRFDSRFTIENWGDRRTLWYDADNKTLARDGWLELDSLSEVLAESNPDVAYPIAKAGAMRWKNDGECGGSPGPSGEYDYAFIVPRKVQLVLLDLHNVSGHDLVDVQVNLRSLSVESEHVYELRDADEEDGTVATAEDVTYQVPGGIATDGHFLVPLAVMLGDYDDRADYDPSAAPDMTYFGPGARVQELVLGTRQGGVNVRPFDPANLSYLYVGYSGASCPSLYTRTSSDVRWVKERNVLVGWNRRSSENTDECLLRRFDGTLRLSEEDREKSYVDRLTVSVSTPLGDVTLQPNLASLGAADGKRFRLAQGESVVLHFEDWRPWMTEPRASITGFYVPEDD